MENMTPDSQALSQGAQLEEFIVEKVLGSGGFGITYLARDTSLGRQVVIKENLPTQFAWRETTTGTVRPRHTTGGDVDDYQWSMRNFLKEAETLASLDHSGIVRVLRKFETNGTAYFVMPFVQGVAFDALIDSRSSKGQAFSETELRGMLDRMLDALGYLHQRGIYHRDIKPANILITMEGIPVLIDFGAARQHISERSLTVVESAGYTPFEQLQSRGNVGPWSDLYALGATVAKAITFETPPKAADRMMGDPWKGLAGDSLLDSSFSQAFLQAVDRSMAVDPRSRWQSAEQWTVFLRQGGSLSAAPPSLPQSHQPAQAIPVQWTQASTRVGGMPLHVEPASNPYQPPASTPHPLSQFTPPYEASGKQVRPWVRFWARTIDTLLFAFCAGIIIGIIAPAMLDLPDTIFGMIALFAYNFVEPAFFTWWGTTPGKALFRIKLLKGDSSRLTYSDALNRVFKVWLRGMGLGIPLVALFTHLNSYNRLTKEGVTSWDKDDGIMVTHQNIGAGRVLATVAILLVALILMAIGLDA